MKILFVCSTNICRSPYAEFHLKKMAEGDSALREKIEWIRSAAVLNRAKHINKKTRAALMEEGFDAKSIDAHIPTHIGDAEKLVADADLIIGMTGWHKAFLPKKAKSKFLTLSEAATGTYKPIPDPWLYKEERYAECLQTMLVYFKLLAERIKRGDEILE